ncbi:hypothetical protein [Jiangella anatolica]|uniref:hypothetical protein n=1 Tax=Jiangella anatolica TaxID=2670374 RepID=UPI0013143929|nr:hypothetical protein [Jiangella anatolica]
MTELLITLLMLILPPCPEEDSTWCHWDAKQQGNGQGSSFVTLAETITLEVNQ